MSVGSTLKRWGRLLPALVVAATIGAGGFWWWTERQPLPTTTTTTTLPVTTTVSRLTTVEILAEVVGRASPSTTAFIPRVASPFTRSELDYFNALATADIVFSRGTAVSAEGIDENGDGRIDRGWHDLDILDVFVSWRDAGRLMCDADRHQSLKKWWWEETSYDTEDADSFITLAEAYLC